MTPDPASPSSSDAGPEPGLAAASGEREELERSVELVRRAQAGDLDAYNRLFERYYLRVRARVRQRMGAALRRDEDSGDVAQEAMVEAIRDLDRFDVPDRRALVGLFAALVENRLRRGAQRQRAQKRDRDRLLALESVREALDSGSLSLEPADPAPTPSEAAAEAERQELMRRCIDRLAPRERRLVHLRDYEQRSWDEVAAAVGASSANAARMMHARAVLRLKLEYERLLRG